MKPFSFKAKAPGHNYSWRQQLQTNCVWEWRGLRGLFGAWLKPIWEVLVLSLQVVSSQIKIKCSKGTMERVKIFYWLCWLADLEIFFRDQHSRRNYFDPITLNSFGGLSVSSSMLPYPRELPPGWLVGEAVLGQGPAMAPHCCRSMHQLSTAPLRTPNPCFCVSSWPETAALSSLLAWSTETKKCTTA